MVIYKFAYKAQKMTAKESFLIRIKDQIKVLSEQLKSLEAIAEQIKNVPDSLFEGLAGMSYPIEITTPKLDMETVAPVSTIETEVEYGRNKKLILHILTTENKALLKTEIEKKFKVLINSENDETKTVTNALASLSSEEYILGYKPKDFKIRGLFWTLPKWWENDDLLSQYKPNAEFYKNKYEEYV